MIDYSEVQMGFEIARFYINDSRDTNIGCTLFSRHDLWLHVEILLLVLLARDAAAAANAKGEYHVRLVEFMKKLLVNSDHVLRALPSRLGDEEPKPFQEMFADSIIYVTQFIKVHNSNVISREFLWYMMARGAATMCKDCQRGVDLIIPFVVKDEKIGQKTTSAIFIQVENDAKFRASPSELLFVEMNPHLVGFFDPHEEPNQPIIRMVFALAAPTSNTQVTPLPKPRLQRKPNASPKFTSYDIWCARASKETFAVIEDEALYKRLLKPKKVFPDAYQAIELLTEKDMRQRMHPGAFNEKSHWPFISKTPTELVLDESIRYDEGMYPSDDEAAMEGVEQ